MTTDQEIEDNIRFMQEQYQLMLLEQEEVKKQGYILDRDCWNCKKHFKKLTYRVCANGYISYWCYECDAKAD